MVALTNIDFKQMCLSLRAAVFNLLKIGVVVVGTSVSVFLTIVAAFGIFIMFFSLYCVSLCRKYATQLGRHTDTRSNATITRVGGIVIHPKKDTTDDRNN